jgi:hypothetical protein
VERSVVHVSLYQCKCADLREPLEVLPENRVIGKSRILFFSASRGLSSCSSKTLDERTHCRLETHETKTQLGKHSARNCVEVGYQMQNKSKRFNRSRLPDAKNIKEIQATFADSSEL